MDEPIHQPHDKFIKKALSDPADAASFFQQRIPPEIVAAIDWSGLRLEAGTFIDSRFRDFETDLLFCAPIAGSGRSCWIYLLFEHLSELREQPALKLLRYMVRIWEQCRTTDAQTELAPIIPVVLAQNAREWKVGTQFSEEFRIPDALREELAAFIPDFRFEWMQLACVPYHELKGTPVLKLALRTLKAEWVGELLKEEVWDEELMAAVRQPFLEAFFRYMVSEIGSTGIDKTAFDRRVKSIRNSKIQTQAMTIAEEYRQEGRQIGWQEGRQEGKIEMQRLAIFDILEVRFGEVPEGLREAICQISDLDHLRGLQRQAVKCSALNDFLQS